ncbi:MAG TPA: TolC family protein [Thermoanaerobaculia bacterium]|nr:TolC family protein [Thermoanaerobaculia bacterium]
MILVVLVAVEVRAQRQLSLDDALALATGTSEQIAVAQAGVQRADANVRRAESQGLPQIAGSGSYNRSLANQFQGITDSGDSPAPPPECSGPFVSDPSLPLEERVRLLEQRLGCPASSPFGGLDFSQLGFGAPNTWNLGLSFNWPLFTGGRVEAQVRASESARDIARASLTSAEAQVRLEVTQAYFDAQLASELVGISEASLTNSGETLRLTEIREKAGAQAEFDVLQARVARDNQRPLLIRRQSQRDLALERLRALLDLPPNEPLVLTTSVSAAASREIKTDTDVMQRVPVQQAGDRLMATRHQLTAARAERMPTITATSNYGLVAYSQNFLPDLGAFRNNWTVGAAIQIPIYTGGRITADIDAARADVAEAEAQLEQTVEAARLDTASALADLRAARATWEATQGTVEQAERGYEIARLRYREGVSIQLEVENARLLLEQARVNRAQAARDLWVAQTRLELLPFLPLNGAQTQQPASAAAQQTMSQQPTQSPIRTTFPAQGGFAQQ